MSNFNSHLEDAAKSFGIDSWERAKEICGKGEIIDLMTLADENHKKDGVPTIEEARAYVKKGFAKAERLTKEELWFEIGVKWVLKRIGQKDHVGLISEEEMRKGL